MFVPDQAATIICQVKCLRGRLGHDSGMLPVSFSGRRSRDASIVGHHPDSMRTVVTERRCSAPACRENHVLRAKANLAELIIAIERALAIADAGPHTLIGAKLAGCLDAANLEMQKPLPNDNDV